MVKIANIQAWLSIHFNRDWHTPTSFGFHGMDYHTLNTRELDHGTCSYGIGWSKQKVSLQHYVHVCMYLYIYICICICRDIYIYIYWIYTYTNTSYFQLEKLGDSHGHKSACSRGPSIWPMIVWSRFTIPKNKSTNIDKHQATTTYLKVHRWWYRLVNRYPRISCIWVYWGYLLGIQPRYGHHHAQ